MYAGIRLIQFILLSFLKMCQGLCAWKASLELSPPTWVLLALWVAGNIRTGEWPHHLVVSIHMCVFMRAVVQLSNSFVTLSTVAARLLCHDSQSRNAGVEFCHSSTQAIF